jgi:hypothetical protein
MTSMIRRSWGAAGLSAALLFVGCGDDSAESGVRVLDLDDEVAGADATALLAVYSRGVAEVPLEDSMLAEPSKCDMGLSTDDVYFAPTFGAPGDTVATCTMQAGQALFVNPVAALCIEGGGDKADVACLDAQWNLTSSSVTIDGTPVDDLATRTIDTSAQPITLPEDNVFGEPAQATNLIARGQVVVVQGLETGKHTVVLAGDFGNGEFAGRLTIDLTVE